MTLNQRKRNQRSNSDLYSFQSGYSVTIHSPTSRQGLFTVNCRRSRVTVAEKQGLAEDSEEAVRKKQADAEQRRKESHDLVAESIRRELLESK